MRYDYANYSSEERAYAALEDMFATGDVLQGEKPRVECRKRKTASWSKAKPRYYITLEG